jgi:LAO/AO transport system kinase
MLRNSFYSHPEIEKQLPAMEQKVLNNEISSFVAAKQMIDLFIKPYPRTSEIICKKQNVNIKKYTVFDITL